MLLGDLGAEIAIVGRPIGADDGERDMVPDAGGGLRRERVAPEVSKNSSTARSLGRRIGEVDHHLCAGHGLAEPSPVMVLTPVLGEAATTSWPPWRRTATASSRSGRCRR